MGLVSEAHIILFPHFLYPLHHTSLAGSIFMTVSIAFERYTAVHYPLDYNQVSNLKILISNILRTKNIHVRTTTIYILHFFVRSNRIQLVFDIDV